jgi:intracellular septation protein A
MSKDTKKEVFAVLVVGTLLALTSFWNAYLGFLPWKPFSVFLLFGVVPLLGGTLYLRRLRRQQLGREAPYPLLTWAAIYWFVLIIVLAFIGGIMQGAEYITGQ